jgi:hypothetical protein
MHLREISELLARVGPLSFCIGATVGEPPNMEAMAAGSGIFIAPFLAITARHVSRSLFALDPGGDPGFSSSFHLSHHSAGLFQVLEPGNPQSDHSLWHVDKSWDFAHSDLCLMQVSAEEGAALGFQYQLGPQYLSVSLLPPPIGATVQAFGYPRHAITARGAQLFIDAPATFSEGVVRENYAPFRDRGLLNFPCFEVEMIADHGFSGGPVFYEGKLCGLVSAGSSFDHSVYVATLWPLVTANVDLGFGKCHVVQELLDLHHIVSPDWPRLKGKIVRKSDDRGEYLDIDEAA